MLEAVLVDRGGKYGEYSRHAKLSQEFKKVMKHSSNWLTLNESMKESLEMIVHKMARILNGDPTHADSWVDISGYSTLIIKELNKENERVKQGDF